MVLKQKRTNTDVLIIDASKGFIKVGKNNKLQESDIKKIVDTIKNRVSIPKYSRVVSNDEIKENDYNLNIPRYVDSSEKTESYDIYASMFGGIPNSEIKDYEDYWNAFPSLKDELFQSNNEPYSTLKSDNVRNIIKNNQDVKYFVNEYKNAFNGFEGYLKTLLIDDAENLNIAKTEEIISNNIFDRLKNISLINQYEAYQYLNDGWNTISGDIEIIQTEGIDAAKVVDPNLVIKKKKEKEVEVQEGWIGHLLPFDLIQSKYLLKEKRELIDKENQVSEIDSEINDIIDILKSLECNLYKYSVIGDNDQKNIDLFNKIMNNSGFKILDNESTYLFYKDINPIKITGINTIDVKTVETNEELTPIFNLVLMHYPDYADNLSFDNAVALSGHSLKGKIRIPFYGGIIKKDGAKKYIDDYYEIGTNKLYVSGGIGTENVKFRFNNKPEINFYRLEKK